MDRKMRAIRTRGKAILYKLEPQRFCASEETVEIFIEADFDTFPEERRRFALLNIPRHLFSEATAAATRRGTTPRPASSA